MTNILDGREKQFAKKGFIKLESDFGLCCSFNMKTADEIFHSGAYSRTQCYKTFYSCNLQIFVLS